MSYYKKSYDLTCNNTVVPTFNIIDNVRVKNAFFYRTTARFQGDKIPFKGAYNVYTRGHLISNDHSCKIPLYLS